jgi:acetyl-CoA carboxylase biotin carboxyl carrier protein
MDIKKIQELIKLVKKTDISELTVKEGDNSISIKNKGTETYVAPPVIQTPAISAPLSETAKPESKPAKTDTSAADTKNENVITFRSPMVGTFYRKPGADKDPYVKVGDTVKGGDVLCIIEAMKLFNEIEFDGSEGRVVKILAEDASPVEYDQPLFLIEKN